MPPKKKAKTEANTTSWEYVGDANTWVPFAAVDCALLETAYRASPAGNFVTAKLSFNEGFTTKYTFNFSAMQQINEDTKRTRLIRRVAPGECMWEWKDDTGLWVQFYDEDNAFIEKMFVRNGMGKAEQTKDLSFNKKFHSTYTFVFVSASKDPTGVERVTGSQKNEDSGKVREIRRSPKKPAWDVTGYGILGAVAAPAASATVTPTAPESAATAPPPATATPVPSPPTAAPPSKASVRAGTSAALEMRFRQGCQL